MEKITKIIAVSLLIVMFVLMFFSAHYDFAVNKPLSWSQKLNIALALLFGYILFKWSSGLYGNKVGLLTLFLFATSPTFLAYSRYPTVDLITSFAFFISIITFINFLRHQTKNNLVVSGISFGVAQIINPDFLLLVPLYLIFSIIWILSTYLTERKKFWRLFFEILTKTAIVFLIGLTIFWLFAQIIQGSVFYSFSLWKLAIKEIDLWYFALLYITKELTGFHLLTLMAIIFSIRKIIEAKEKSVWIVIEWIKDNFVIFCSLVFIIIYVSKLIILSSGIQMNQIMPVLPFIYFLVARQIVRWARTYSLEEPQTTWGQIKHIVSLAFQSFKKYSFLLLIIIWMFFSILLAFPNYSSYLNILSKI